jgi:hypothetical protein
MSRKLRAVLMTFASAWFLSQMCNLDALQDLLPQLLGLNLFAGFCACGSILYDR